MSKHYWVQVDHDEYRCRECKEVAFDGDFPSAHDSECPMTAPAPTTQDVPGKEEVMRKHKWDASGTCEVCGGFWGFRKDTPCQSPFKAIDPAPAPTNELLKPTNVSSSGKEDGEEELAKKWASGFYRDREFLSSKGTAAYEGYLAGIREGKRLGRGERVAPFVREHREALECVIAERDAALERNAKLLRDIDTLSVEHGKEIAKLKEERDELKRLMLGASGAAGEFAALGIRQGAAEGDKK